MAFIRQLVILAGGKGTRLGEHAKSTPKPLMQITSDRVFLDYLIENAARQGFRDILIIAGHLGEQIVDRYHHRSMGGAEITVLVEPEPRGTAGALAFAQPHLAGAFLVLNGDTFYDINYRKLAATLEAHADWDAVIALRTVEDAGRYGSIDIDSDGRITGFFEKDSQSQGRRGLINGGAYAIRRRALDRIATYPCSIETDVFPAIAAQARLGSMAAQGYFIDIGLPETLHEARETFPERRSPVLFLDRDGVLNVDIHHLHRPDQWQWIDGAIEAIRAANDCGARVVIVTNQAGIAKGKYRECDFLALSHWMREELAAHGAFVDAIQYCPYHTEAVDEAYAIEQPIDRKPQPDMLLRAARQLPIDLKRALFIGDQETDRLAAEAAGIAFEKYQGGNLAERIAATPAWQAMKGD
jgi:D-glycero-D-manno-heptose 1,7-bisphosphate phosphatase